MSYSIHWEIHVPSLIREEALAQPVDLVVIDEIQKLPSLIQRFLLIGSSARKLRRSHTSLMAGRAIPAYLKPFVSAELGDQFNLDRQLLYGALPPVALAEDPDVVLSGYVGEYLQEEIRAEALSRNVENFARFLSRAALSNGQINNFESVASDAQVPSRTVREYNTVLEDRLTGTMLNPLTGEGSRKVVSKAKFYFFDTGVVHELIGQRSLPDGSQAYADVGLARRIIVSSDPVRRIFGRNIEIIPINEFLSDLWNGKIG